MLCLAESTNPGKCVDSARTTPADLAPFTADDLNEAHERLNRLANCGVRPIGRWTTPPSMRPSLTQMTLRQIEVHTAESIVYATTIGAP
jgi:hypothetical protein